jgi:hypothetical protein
MTEPRLKAFTLAIMADWPDVGDLDGFDLQDIAVEHGVLVGEERSSFCTAPGEEGCQCAEYYDECETFTCYRLHPSLKP